MIAVHDNAVIRGLCFLLGLVWLLPAWGAELVALVIGNASYRHMGVLINPQNDARAVAEALKRHGFELAPLVLDANKVTLQLALRDFAPRAARARQAVVFYAGHGVEAMGENYLVPVDARLAQKSTVSLEEVMDVVGTARELGLVILAAGAPCAQPAGCPGRDGKHLQSIEPGRRLLVAYAAKAGTHADDGVGQRNSPFTQALLEALNAPSRDVRLLFGAVHDRVLQLTEGQQESAIYSLLDSTEVHLGVTPDTVPSGAVSAPLEVSAETPVAERFSKRAEGVYDAEQGVIWAAADNGGDINWNAAKDYCASKGLGWVLPTVVQLRSLYDESGMYVYSTRELYAIKPATPLIMFSSTWFWSSETPAPSVAFLVPLSNGGVLAYDANTSDTHRALCVRRP